MGLRDDEIEQFLGFWEMVGPHTTQLLAEDLLEARRVLRELITAHHNYCDAEHELLAMPMADRRGSAAHVKTAEAIRVLGLAEDKAEALLGIVDGVMRADEEL